MQLRGTGLVLRYRDRRDRVLLLLLSSPSIATPDDAVACHKAHLYCFSSAATHFLTLRSSRLPDPAPSPD